MKLSAKQAVLQILRNPLKALLIGLIHFYRAVISPGIPSRCKYYPSCSHYALDALQEYGVARGFVLAVWRVLRCNPLSYGGYDPVSRQRLFRPRGGEIPSPPSTISAQPTAVATPSPVQNRRSSERCHSRRHHGHLVRG